jgi:hypothetical protein
MGLGAGDRAPTGPEVAAAARRVVGAPAAPRPEAMADTPAAPPPPRPVVVDPDNPDATAAAILAVLHHDCGRTDRLIQALADGLPERDYKWCHLHWPWKRRPVPGRPGG